MTTKEKLFIGLEGLKELIGQRDVALIKRYHNGEDRTQKEDVNDDHVEIINMRDVERGLTSFIDDIASRERKGKQND